MTHKTLSSRNALESCTFQLHSWNPFHIQTHPKTLDSEIYLNSQNALRSKKPCLSDRATAPNPAVDLDFSKLTLIDDDHPSAAIPPRHNRDSFRWMVGKRRRRGSRSVSGRSSDRSATRRCCSLGCGASGAYATCSDFPVLAGTDSSGELFLNGGGDGNWASDVSEARNSRRDGGRDVGGGVERQNSGGGVSSQGGVFEVPGNESGYGSEPGYRGDAEFGYGDEFDEEEDDGRLLFWGDRLGDKDQMEIVGESTFSEQKIHHRCRRKKHDWRIIAPLSGLCPVTLHWLWKPCNVQTQRGIRARLRRSRKVEKEPMGRNPSATCIGKKPNPLFELERSQNEESDWKKPIGCLHRKKTQSHWLPASIGAHAQARIHR